MAEQCVAWLYGKYVPYDGFEDGVSAEVHAIYEPPQVQKLIEITTIFVIMMLGNMLTETLWPTDGRHRFCHTPPRSDERAR